MAKVAVEKEGTTAIVSIDRFAEARNAVDPETAILLREAFLAFDADESQSVAILTGRGGAFCTPATTSKVAASRENPSAFDPAGPGPMGPTRHLLSKPVIAAVEGYAVAGGLELALWCDMRVASERQVRRVLPALGCAVDRWRHGASATPRRPRRALDMILTGREVGAREAFDWGLANRLAPEGWAGACRSQGAGQRAGEIPPNLPALGSPVVL